MRKTVAMVLMGAFLVAGCRVEANIRLDVDAEGAGAFTAEFGFDEEFLSVIEQAGGSPEDIFDVAATDEELEVTTEGDMTYYSATQAFADIDELNEVVAELAGSESEFAEFSLTLNDDGGATLGATLVAPDAAEAADMDGMGAMSDVFSASFVADLPGRVVESNADEVLSDGRLRWTIPFEGGEVDIQAVTTGAEDEGSGFPLTLVIGGLVAALVVVGGVVLMQRRNRGSASAVASQTPPPPPRDWGSDTNQDA